MTTTIKRRRRRLGILGPLIELQRRADELTYVAPTPSLPPRPMPAHADDPFAAALDEARREGDRRAESFALSVAIGAGTIALLLLLYLLLRHA